ncbi:hypothetical protein BJ742DRAFT_850001 [Cladochytrium replicatum]|nr:hypothetical protein BJ742DRAFT_850001 [Cladochytrium replicatum]
MPKDYAYALLSAVAMRFQITLVGAWPGKLRRQFGLEYPDMGNDATQQSSLTMSERYSTAQRYAWS